MSSEAIENEFAQRSWEEAGDNLFTAMKKYQDALVTLNGVFDTTESFANRKEFSSKIDSHLYNLTALNPCRLLHQLRNRYKPFINWLPLETKARIFELAIDWASPIMLYGNPKQDIYQRTTAITAVCRQWRSIIINTHILWSLVTFFGQDCEEADNPLAKLWLERSASAPLCLVFCHQKIQPFTIVPIIMPHANRFRTLSILADNVENTHAIIKCWLENGAPGSLTEFSASTWNGFHHLLPPSVTQNVPQEVIASFLRPIRILRLKNVYFDWTSDAYEGLLEFRLETRKELATDTLMKLLTASPCLKVLMLGRMSLAQPLTPFNHSITLPDLRTLYLDDLPPGSTKVLLSILASGSFQVHLNFSARSLPPLEINGPIEITSLIPIFARLQAFKVHTLSLERVCQAEDLRTLLQSLPQLRGLYLYDANWRYDADMLNAMTRTANSEPIETSVVSHSLRLVHMAGTILDQEAFKAMVSSHTLEDISFGGWVHLDSGSETKLDETHELYNCIKEQVPRAICFDTGDVAHVSRFRPFLWRHW
ncbi:hypothetical protein RhiJN_03756 [Ceratobasidium sp. AG-Ba]|nr:hypothetical protein RhiJN_03756 [Ceratobasidium sp. AG-Ba]